MEVPADFLDTISEEKNENKQTTGQQIAKKYPFNRTTTPNSLREHLKETLTKNLGGKDYKLFFSFEPLSFAVFTVLYHQKYSQTKYSAVGNEHW